MGRDDHPPESMPVSLLLRQETRKKHSRGGVLLLVLGVPPLGVAVWGMVAEGGFQIVHGWAAILGVVLVAVGISLLGRASRSA
jgi:hypothetical protein